jgi:hypothetical protein
MYNNKGMGACISRRRKPNPFVLVGLPLQTVFPLIVDYWPKINLIPVSESYHHPEDMEKNSITILVNVYTNIVVAVFVH